MYKTEYNIKSFSSARSGRAYKVILAPPFLIYAVFGISILVQIPVGFVIHRFSFTLGMLINQLGTLLLPVLVVIRFFGLTGSEVVPFKRVKAWQVILAVFIMLALAVISDYLLFVTEEIVPVHRSLDDIYKDLMHVESFGGFFYKLLFLCIMPSFCEEIFFRGFCQTGLGRHYGRWSSIMMVASMFAVAHLSQWYIHIYFLLGIVLGWMFATNGSLWIPVVCHLTNNLWTFTSHAVGWELSPGGRFGWGDALIIMVSVAVLVPAIAAWHRLSKGAPVKTLSQNF